MGTHPLRAPRNPAPFARPIPSHSTHLRAFSTHFDTHFGPLFAPPSSGAHPSRKAAPHGRQPLPLPPPLPHLRQTHPRSPPRSSPRHLPLRRLHPFPPPILPPARNPMGEPMPPPKPPLASRSVLSAPRARLLAASRPPLWPPEESFSCLQRTSRGGKEGSPGGCLPRTACAQGARVPPPHANNFSILTPRQPTHYRFPPTPRVRTNLAARPLVGGLPCAPPPPSTPADNRIYENV
jgi:hypothetical protein